MNRFLLFLSSLVLLAISAESADTRVVRDVKYAAPDGHELLLDLYLPAKSKHPHSAVIFVHGGGWKNGSKKAGKKIGPWLSDAGFVVASIDYRLTDVAGWPAQIDDCYTAVRWLRKHAKTYHVDPTRIGAFGTSAGAHLAALMGTRPNPNQESTSSQVQAVCDWFGPSDLLTMPPNNIGNGRTAEDVAKSNGAKLLRATVRDVPDLAKDASALHQVSIDDASFLIMHGDEDPGVPLAQSQRLHAALINAGVSSQLKIIKGAGHGGPLFQTAKSQQTVISFFQRTLLSNWPQGGGPFGNFQTRAQIAPKNWSVVQNNGIAWRKTLPETGQSTVTVWQDRIFFTTLKEVTADASTGASIVAWCCDAATGKTIWTRPIDGNYPLRLSGCFSDSSGPPPVTNGNLVCFFNASGRISCFDFDGNEVWSKDTMTVGRSQPFMVDNNIVFTRQRYMPDSEGHFSHEHKNAPLDKWTQLQALNISTGKIAWTSTCGVNMGCVPLLQNLPDGRRVIVVGRGGGHSPPETPIGISMISAEDGSTIWTLPLPKFMSTMTFNTYGEHVLVFHAGRHLWINPTTGKIDREISIVGKQTLRSAAVNGYTSIQEMLPTNGKRAIIQQSNVVAGNYHYFRHYKKPYLGRVHLVTGNVENLQLPTQANPNKFGPSDLLWTDADMPPELVAELKKKAKKKTKSIPIEQWSFKPNTMLNSRGFEVMGDARSRGTGWGHHASQVPTVVGSTLYLPVMNGTVYVIKADAETLDEDAVLSINDLGPVGDAFNRASISYANGRLYAHTIRELICISPSK